MTSSLRFGASLLLATAFARPGFAQTQPQSLADFRRVVVSSDAPLSTRMAADDLAAYAGRVSGKPIEVIFLSKYQVTDPGLSFFVGEGAAAKALGKSPAPWKTEEWMQETVPGGLVLAGQDGVGKAASLAVSAGSQLAVYTLLDETLGVKWFWPGPFGEHVPANPTAKLPVFHTRGTPRFIIRQYSVGYGSLQTDAFREETAKWQRRTRQGWAPRAWFGHSWYSAFNFRDQKATDQLVKDHPDWFALVGGKRRPPQMCTTNPEVIDKMVEFVLADKKNVITSISPSDGGGFCECDRCTALDVPGILAYDGKTPQLSDRIFTYANTIAKRVREKQPDKGVGMFAYTFYNNPPVKIPKLEPNLYLSFVHQAMADVDPEVQKDWKKSTEDWQKVTQHMVMREGWGNHYLLDLPFPHDDEILESFSFAASHGFLAAYGEGSKAFANQSPNTWAVIRMMWDPQQKTSAVMDQYYNAAYGPAAAEMKAFFGTLRTSLKTNWPNRRFISPARGMTYANLINSWDIVYPPSALEAANKHLVAAAKIAPPGEYSDRIKFHQFGFEYTQTLLELLRCYRQLADSGVKIDAFVNLNEGKEPALNPTQLKATLQRAFELGEKREQLLLAHRDWAAIDEGLYAFTNKANIRQWHAGIKKQLGINTPSRLSPEAMAAAKGSMATDE